jgi:hypothetical protein
MNSTTPHLSPEALLRIVDELPSDAESNAHLDLCSECRDRLSAFAQTVRDYERFHKSTLKRSLPAPPRRWERLDFPPTRRSPMRPARWLLAAAAAIAVLFIGVRLFEPTPTVRAAELLRKASAVEQAVPSSHRRIRIRTNSRVLDRDASPGPGAESRDASVLHALFDSAGYSWDNPLSAQAFSRWRASVGDTQDQVEKSSGVYVVRTSAERGPLSDAALSLRTADLHVFACTLRFRSGGEIVQVTELPVAMQSPPEAVPAPGLKQRLVLVPAKAPSAGDEVRVIAALHGIGADLGEPVEVERNGAVIVVRVSGLDEHRHEEIRKALSGLSLVLLQFEAVTSNDLKAPTPDKLAAAADRPNPLIADIVNQLGGNVSISDFRDELINAADRAAERAFALRALARRFPQNATSSLSGDESAMLGGILRDHAGSLTNATQEIRRMVAPILLNPPSSSPESDGNWQTLAEGLPVTVDRLDRLLNGATDSSDMRKAQIAQSMTDLSQQVTELTSRMPQ